MPGIDLILSAGSTTELKKPIKAGGARIFSLAKGSGKVGSIKYSIEDNEYKYSSYKAIKLGKKYKNSSAVKKVMKKIDKTAGKNYFATSGFSSGQTLCKSYFNIAPIKDNAGKKGDSPMGELVADAFIYSALEDAKLPKGNFIGLSSELSASSGFDKGNVKVNDVFKMMSSGKSADGSKGRALALFYMKGSDVKKFAEIAAISCEDNTADRFYFSGLNYKYNPHRFKESRVYDITVSEDDMNLGIKLADDTIYRFVTDTETAKAVKKLENYVNEDLRIKVVDEKGAPLGKFSELTRFSDTKSTKKVDEPLKAWAAVSSYMITFKESGIPASYRRPDGRMEYDDSKALSHVYKGELFTLLMMFLVALIGIAAFIVLVLLILNLAGVKTIGRKRGAANKKEHEKADAAS